MQAVEPLARALQFERFCVPNPDQSNLGLLRTQSAESLLVRTELRGFLRFLRNARPKLKIVPLIFIVELPVRPKENG